MMRMGIVGGLLRAIWWFEEDVGGFWNDVFVLTDTGE
jgi:hypothetical protein